MMKTFESVFEETLEDLRHLKTKDRFLDTGFSSLNKILCGGLYRPSTVVIGGRPGTGKTTFVNQLVRNIVKAHSDVVVFYFSLEMSPVLQMKKFISLELGMTLEEINAMDEEELREKVREFAKSKILFYSEALNLHVLEKTVEERVKIWNSMNLKYRPLVVLDHSRLISKFGQKTEKDKLDDLSLKMMEMKRKYGCVNIIISQLNRSSEAETYKTPGQADIYGSDALVQDADLVILLSKLKPDFSFKDRIISSDDYVGAYVVKNRFGPEDKILFYSQLEINKFLEA